MNDKPSENLPARPEATNILNEANSEAGFEKMLKFKKGQYECDGEEIPLDTRMVAHAIGWAKAWIKFKDKQVVERKIYKVAQGQHAPDRDQLDEREERLWPMGINQRPQDPWVFQFLLPMEDPEDGEVRIFVTSSFGGKRAVADLCKVYALRAQRDPNCGQPIVRLKVMQMQTSNYGKVPRPHFDVIGWNDGSMDVKEVSEGALRKQDFDDDIPF